LSRVVLVDNSPVSLLINPENSILVSSFYANPDDTALGQLLPVLRKLHTAGDVRETLGEQFQLREALQQSGWDLDDIQRRHEAQMKLAAYQGGSPGGG
jgi:TFIIF-interacting CTD phosphatase-like protein